MSIAQCFVFILLQIPGFSLIENKVAAFQETSGVRQATVSVSVKDCESNNYVININGDKAINSASTMKLISTATALEVLGQNFTYSTELSCSGQIINNELNGNLYISSNGDPSFGSSRWGSSYQKVIAEVMSSVKNVGINKLKGSIILMNTGFEDFDVSDTWAWNDLGNYYGATPYLFNFNENKFSVYFSAGDSVDEPASIITMKPQSDYWNIINKVTTGPAGSGDNVYIYSTPLSNTILMKGTIPLRSRNFLVRGSIPNPPLVFGELLKDELTKNGVAVEGEVLLQSYKSAQLNTLYIINSKPLSELLESCNYFSINLLADAFVKQVGYKFAGSYTYESGITATKNFWKNRGVNVDALNMKDGSGLSPSGTITANVMCDILSEMKRSSLFETFTSTIPQLGISGTVSRIGDGRNKNMFVKSGSIEATRAYAGYFKTSTGKWMTFMVGVNRYDSDSSRKVNAFLREILVDLSKL
ncbi:MAG: D-alanyl-D-alanine carboxypeptidase/D-alanyl-D-alanine-endopeptidase (penicillin-binding protein 4) [Spirosomataceae bacterium]|jgi:D-alanyl-D-alanine carboxypeptidase/D-alanyl-D-alanine-endopeptidase (penicillin-binding protein 4)